MRACLEELSRPVNQLLRLLFFTFSAFKTLQIIVYQVNNYDLFVNLTQVIISNCGFGLRSDKNDE